MSDRLWSAIFSVIVNLIWIEILLQCFFTHFNYAVAGSELNIDNQVLNKWIFVYFCLVFFSFSVITML